MNENHKLIQELWNKIISLKKGEMLWTTFGPSHQYWILKEKRKYKIQERDLYSRWNSIKKEYELNSPTSIVEFLNTYPEVYAENVFNNQNIHWENWTNFVKSFKLTKIKERTKKEIV